MTVIYMYGLVFIFKSNKNDRKNHLKELMIYKSFCDNNCFHKARHVVEIRNFLSTKAQLNQVFSSAISLSAQSKKVSGTGGGGALTELTARWYMLLSFCIQVKNNKKAVKVQRYFSQVAFQAP